LTAPGSVNLDVHPAPWKRASEDLPREIQGAARNQERAVPFGLGTPARMARLQRGAFGS